MVEKHFCKLRLSYNSTANLAAGDVLLKKSMITLSASDKCYLHMITVPLRL
jgi:hypothetical protein